MTPERAKELLPIVAAIAAGDEIECRMKSPNCYWGEWNSRQFSDDYEYRVKAKPVARPWSKPEDVPLNCWIRRKGATSCELITAVYNEGVGRGEGRAFILKWDGTENCEYSTDRKTWLPCTVTDPA